MARTSFLQILILILVLALIFGDFTKLRKKLQIIIKKITHK